MSHNLLTLSYPIMTPNQGMRGVKLDGTAADRISVLQHLTLWALEVDESSVNKGAKCCRGGGGRGLGGLSDGIAGVRVEVIEAQ
jgi:hypothetical protein